MSSREQAHYLILNMLILVSTHYSVLSIKLNDSLRSQLNSTYND